MSIPPSIHAFWRAFTSTIGHDPSDRFYEAFHFDDNAPSADELAALVLAGTKRATAGLVWAFESQSASPSQSQVTSASSRCFLVSLCASSRPRASRSCRSPTSTQTSQRPRAKAMVRLPTGSGPTRRSSGVSAGASAASSASAHLLSARGSRSYTEAPARMRSNPSLQPTCYGWLRQPSQAAELKR